MLESQSRMCTELVSDWLPSCVPGHVLSFSGFGCVCLSWGQSIVSIPGMEWGSGKGGELSTLTMNKSYGGEGMQRQSSPESDSSHHPRPPWPCCRALDDAGPPEGQAFHPTGQDLTGGGTQLDTLAEGKGREGFLEKCAWEPTLEG